MARTNFQLSTSLIVALQFDKFGGLHHEQSSPATPAPTSQYRMGTKSSHKKNTSRLGLKDNPSNATMLIHEDNSTVRDTVTPTTYRVCLIVVFIINKAHLFFLYKSTADWR